MKKRQNLYKQTEDRVVNSMSYTICKHRTYVHLGCFYEINFNYFVPFQS